MITEELTNQLFDALVKRKERFESDFGDIRIRTYSGRGMYGSYCLGLVCEGCYHNAMLFWLADTIKEELPKDAHDAYMEVIVLGESRDSMGYDTVNYFQQLRLAYRSEDTEDENEDEDFAL
ncbi:hypothetical protein E6P75_11880 [Moraxella osloensis]|jgi:hypothetical protein|uniref:Uncharacterized protein n=1 Tax=Faucicola osloensis TaxID=34062 RepID=A0AAW6TKY3_FAUOS|nr:hypothetical protein [Moraxella osloensis]MDI4510894.1 hypothetical protein [Moraxella osloensis]